jgi:hypothetical protein
MNEYLFSQFLTAYSQHPKTGRSGFRMVIFRTLFESGFRTVSHLVFTIRKPDREFFLILAETVLYKRIFFL